VSPCLWPPNIPLPHDRLRHVKIFSPPKCSSDILIGAPIRSTERHSFTELLGQGMQYQPDGRVSSLNTCSASCIYLPPPRFVCFVSLRSLWECRDDDFAQPPSKLQSSNSRAQWASDHPWTHGKLPQSCPSNKWPLLFEPHFSTRGWKAESKLFVQLLGNYSGHHYFRSHKPLSTA
jgi:hypothetical protein